MKSKLQEYLSEQIPDISQMDIDYNERIFENMLEFIADLDPEILSEEQLETILNIIDDLEIAETEEEEVSEVQRKVVIRAGKKVRKAICRPGYKWLAKLKKCVKMKAAEKLRKKRAAIKSARKRRAKKAQIARKRARSLKKRRALGAS